MVGIVRVEVLDPQSSILASRTITNNAVTAFSGSNGFTHHVLGFRVPQNTVSATVRITDISPSGGWAVDPLVDALAVAPVPVADPENLLDNGSFEWPPVDPGTYIYLAASGLGQWQTDQGGFEVWVEGFANTQSAHGRQNLEVQGGPAPSGAVWQTVATTVGQDYELSFYYSPRPGYHTALSVAVNAQTLATLDADGGLLEGLTWRMFKTNFTATSPTTVLRFTDAPLVSGGAHIDNVVLKPITLSASLLAPIDGATFLEPETITLNAQVTPGASPIAVVHFYSNATHVAQVTTPPYTVTLSNVMAGSYSFSAQVMDSTGHAASSDPVHVVCETCQCLESSLWMAY
jgi:hypothetical protein